MKHLFSCLLVFFSVAVHAQSHGFQAYPLKGKIKTIEIVKQDGESGVQVDYTEFDKNGKILYKRKKDYSHYPQIQKSVFGENEITTYKCMCESIEPLEQKFKPIGFIVRDRTREGYGTGTGESGSEQPRVEISKTDSKGNVTETYYYRESGYVQSYSQMSYDKENRLIKKESFDAYKDLFYYENLEYDKRGNNTKRSSKFTVDPHEANQFYTYDEEGNLTESINKAGERLASHYRYFIEKQGNIEFHYSINVLKNDTVKTREVELNKLAQEVKRTSFQNDGTVYEVLEKEYYKSGRKEREVFRKADGSILREARFADDMLGNCIEITQYINTTTVLPEGGKKTEVLPHLFTQKISYF